MRFILAVTGMITLASYSALAEPPLQRAPPQIAPPFAEDGVYIAAGEFVDVTREGQCYRLTNHDRSIGFFFRPSDPAQWPSDREDKRDPMEPRVTEGPCL